jgi:hypothetical protein
MFLASMGCYRLQNLPSSLRVRSLREEQHEQIGSYSGISRETATDVIPLIPFYRET